jgi:hypothetical protein
MRHLPILFALLLPAACAQQGPEDSAQALQDVLVTHQASIASLGGRPAAAQVDVAEPVRPAASRTVSMTSPTTSPTMAGQLLGHTPDTLRRLLGEPRLRREEGPAEVWHYQATQCHLDLVLYREEDARGALRVAYASARAVGTARRGEAQCLRDIARGATPPEQVPVATASAVGT